MVFSYTRPRDPTASAIRTPTLLGVSHRCGPMAPRRSNLTSHWMGRTMLATSTLSSQMIWSFTESYRWLAHSISPSKMLDSLAKGSSLWIPSLSSSLSGAFSQLNSSRRSKLVLTATNCKISSKVMVIVKSWSVTRTKQLILNVLIRKSQKAQTWTHTGCLMSYPNHCCTKSTILLRWVVLFTCKLAGMLSLITITSYRVHLDGYRTRLRHQLMAAINLPIKHKHNKLIRLSLNHKMRPKQFWLPRLSQLSAHHPNLIGKLNPTLTTSTIPPQSSSTTISSALWYQFTRVMAWAPATQLSLCRVMTSATGLSGALCLIADSVIK